MRVLRERRLHIPGAAITLAIIGASHFVEVTTAEAALCELLACPHPGLEAAPARLQRKGARPWRFETDVHGISYRSDLWRSGYGPAEFRAESARLSAEGPRRLLYAFPGGGTAPAGGVTCIEWEVDGRRARIATYHTFPDELVIVHTRSVIYVEEAGESP